MGKKGRIPWKLLGQIFWSFFKIGPITFGGGYAMIPVFHKEAVERRRWLQEEDVADILAIAQSTPGAVGVNASTFVGYRVAGVCGALAALTGMLLPTFLIVLTLCVSYLFVKDQEKIQAAFLGIRPAVAALIAYAGYRIWRTSVKDAATLMLAVCALGFLLLTGVNPAYAIAAGIVAGITLASVQLRWFGRDVLRRPLSQESYSCDDYYIGDGI
ncbi:chromate transporter [Gorillibacterium sp. sgz5001074]|uniref:chromate transporter n=1 Tax=Gorillibacterium sp. sgz5001074 TaxID=3446695 RepID=UPI003F68122D